MTRRTGNISNRVLVIVGEPATQSFIKRTLESVLLEVDTASRYEQALEKIHARSWALVIIDPTLPRVDGLELLRELKKISPATLHKTIVIAEPHTLNAERIAGEFACKRIEKPVTRQELIQAVSECLREPNESQS